MLRVVVMLALSISMAACMTELDRYQWNRNQARVCPDARGLADSDLDQIARVVAHAVPTMVAYWITLPARDHSLRAVLVDVAVPGRAGECPDRECYGWCELAKEQGSWRLVKYHKTTDPFMWGGCPQT